MKGFLNEYTNVKVQKIPFTSNGVSRTVGESGVSHKTPVISVKNNIVKIILASLGYTILAEIENSNVEVFKSGIQSHTMSEHYTYAF